MKRLPKEDRAGLYLTVIAHLTVIIVLLAVNLHKQIRAENTFVLDFTKQEELEKLQEQVEQLQKEKEFQEAISRKLQEELAGSAPVYRNIAVDRAALKDDRGTDAEQLYKDAERLQKELNAGYDLPDEDHADPTPYKKDDKDKGEPAAYSGPSVVSYYLEGRKASHLSIPAYRCLGAGQVTVLIQVDPSGKVVNAKIDDSVSSTDGCLRAFAVRAARLSKFSASTSAPARQTGNIVYEFIAQ